MVLLDGTLVRTCRRTGTDNRKNFSGKHKAHGLLFLALTDKKGNLIWISAAKPGRSSEITAARHNKITGNPVRPGSGPWPTSASSAWTTIPMTGGHHRPQGHPQPLPHRRGEGSEPPAQPRTRRRRARLANLKSWRGHGHRQPLPAAGWHHHPQGAVDQDHPATRSGDLLECAVQAWGAGGEQADGLAHPPGDGGAVHSVPADEVAGPLVTAQHRQHDSGDLPRGQGPATANRSSSSGRVLRWRGSSGWRSTAAGGRCRQGRQGLRRNRCFSSHQTQLPPGARWLRSARAFTDVR